MGNNVPLLVFGTFLFLFLLMTLVSILKPEFMVNLTAKYFRWMMKLYGFEGEIKPTPKAITICRVWNIFMLLILNIFMFLAFAVKSK